MSINILALYFKPGATVIQIRLMEEWLERQCRGILGDFTRVGTWEESECGLDVQRNPTDRCESTINSNTQLHRCCLSSFIRLCYRGR